MYYVYILKSLEYPGKHYVGLTTDLKKRLRAHNDGKTIYGNKYRPWNIDSYMALSNKSKALQFEKYLKKGSGHAFLKRHLL